MASLRTFSLVVIVSSTLAWYEPPPSFAAPSKAQQKVAKKAKAKKRSSMFKTMSLLDNRLNIRVPKTAYKRARGHSLMAAPQPNQRETRVIVIDHRASKMQLVMMAYERFATFGKGSKKAILNEWKARYKGKVNFKLQRSAQKGSYQIYHLIPQNPTQKRVANFIRGVYFVQADKTMQSVELYGSPQLMVRFKQASLLAQRMLDTLKPGKRKLNFKAGTRMLKTFAPSQSLAIKVPQGYYAIVQKGPDFLVHRIYKFAPYGQRRTALMVYIGHHPSLFYRRAPKKNTVLEQPTIQLFGKKARWLRWYVKNAKKRYILKEVIVPIPNLPGRYVAHVTFSFQGKDKHIEKALTQIASSLRVVALPKKAKKKPSKR